MKQSALNMFQVKKWALEGQPRVDATLWRLSWMMPGAGASEWIGKVGTPGEK